MKRTSMLVLFAVASMSCPSQSPATCQMQGQYRLVLSPTSMTGPCAVAEAETMGFEVYSAVPNVTQFNFVYRPSGLTDLLNDGRVDESGASADGTGIIPQDSNGGLCTAHDLKPAAQQFAQVQPQDGGAPTPETSISYAWTSLEVISTARALGTLLRGELVKTVDGCAVTYAVRGIAPGASCEVDEDCRPFVNPDGGRPRQKSGISADVSLLPNGELNLMCTGGGLDADGNPTGVCDVNYAVRSFEDILKAVQ